uniref:Uncharacterized protein n=1 Tax=Romanomermis culicivorax TaxID=13658 RepID=A0A915J187_ROMCU
MSSNKPNLMYKHDEEDSSGDEEAVQDARPLPPLPKPAEKLAVSGNFEESRQGQELGGSKAVAKLKKAPDLPIIEGKNWLLNQYFVQQNYTACLSLIKQLLDESAGNCEFAFYIRDVETTEYPYDCLHYSILPFLFFNSILSGLIVRQEGKLQESLENFQSCLKIDPYNVVYMKNLAQNLLLLGKVKQALKALDEAVRISDGSINWEIHYWYALCYKNSKDLSKAKEHLNFAINSSNKREEPLQLLAEIFVDENDVTGAIDCYKKIVEMSPENPDHLSALGLLYLRTDSEQQAFELIGRALGFDPNHVGAILAAGSMIQKHGDNDVALNKYRVAAQQWPDNAQLWSNIGMSFQAKKKYVAVEAMNFQAISSLKRANYLAPFDWKILYNLGLVHHEMQQYASAYHFLSSSINLNPKVGRVYALLASMHTFVRKNNSSETMKVRWASKKQDSGLL